MAPPTERAEREREREQRGASIEDKDKQRRTGRSHTAAAARTLLPALGREHGGRQAQLVLVHGVGAALDQVLDDGHAPLVGRDHQGRVALLVLHVQVDPAAVYEVLHHLPASRGAGGWRGGGGLR